MSRSPAILVSDSPRQVPGDAFRVKVDGQTTALTDTFISAAFCMRARHRDRPSSHRQCWVIGRRPLRSGPQLFEGPPAAPPSRDVDGVGPRPAAHINSLLERIGLNLPQGSTQRKAENSKIKQSNYRFVDLGLHHIPSHSSIIGQIQQGLVRHSLIGSIDHHSSATTVCFVTRDPIHMFLALPTPHRPFCDHEVQAVQKTASHPDREAQP